jgi:hypothetical protein
MTGPQQELFTGKGAPDGTVAVNARSAWLALQRSGVLWRRADETLHAGMRCVSIADPSPTSSSCGRSRASVKCLDDAPREGEVGPGPEVVEAAPVDDPALVEYRRASGTTAVGISNVPIPSWSG